MGFPFKMFAATGRQAVNGCVEVLLSSYLGIAQCLLRQFICGSFAAVTGMKRTCATCNSEDVSTENLSRPGPSLFYTVLFGWLFLLCRLAFVPRRGICRDCGAPFRYRTIGSYLAMALVILLVLLVAWGLIVEIQNPAGMESDY